jgi:serine/threonine protein kinase
MTNQFPEEFGKYKIIEEVGRGGFAAVYEAVDTTLTRCSQKTHRDSVLYSA